jgi:hypothetical protein
MRKLPSTWSIVSTDNACHVMTVFAPVLFFLALMIKLTGTVPGGRGKPDQPVDPEFANWALASTSALVIFFWALVAMRVSRIRSLFDRGEEVEATIKKVSRFKGGATLKLEFQRAGTAYKVRSSFRRDRRTPDFTAGERISLLVNPDNPRRAVPVVLYERADPARAPERDARVALEQPDAASPRPKKLGLQLSSGSSQPARRGDDR